MVVANKTRRRRNKYHRRSRRRKRGGGLHPSKVAILFYGRISSYEKSIEYINSIYKNPRFMCVVFCSLNLKKKSPYIEDFCKQFNVTDEQINIEPTQFPASYAEDPHNKTFCAGPTSCVNTYSLNYHQNKAFKLMEKYQANHNMLFDTVVVFRADMNSKHPPNEFPIEDTIIPNTIYIPQMSSGESEHGAVDFHKNGLTTIAAYGNNEAMKKYTSLVEHIKSEINHPEIMLSEHLHKMGLTVKRFEHNIKLNPERKDPKYPNE